MIKKDNGGVFLKNGREIMETAALSPEEARKGTIAYGILTSHNTSGDGQHLKIKFDAMASHDITYVGIIQTARASGLTRFPMPYVLTNCHNSLCAVGGTINEDDHMFGLSAAKKYGGIYVPAHQAVIHSFMRETMSGCGRMILGSDSHTRYGALGTMAIGEGGPELVKQLLGRTYDIDMPGVVAVRMTGKIRPGVGPQDVALAIIGAVFADGFVKNKVMEFVGDGIAGLPAEFRNGIDVMTTETTCLSSIWETDEVTRDYFCRHHRPEAYKALKPADIAYYDGCLDVDLSDIEPMIALPYHPSNVYTIRDLCANARDILTPLGLGDKIAADGSIRADQGVIAGCAGGTFDNLCAAADILRGQSVGADSFTISAYPASQPVFLQLMKNGCASDLMDAGVVLRSAFCGPCFGAGDVPSNGGFSLRHSTRNFPNREGSRPSDHQSAYVALMDARSIAATAANGGRLTSGEEYGMRVTPKEYVFDDTVYKNRVYDGYGKADDSVPLKIGPNIADWPEMPALADDILLSVASVIQDAVTTTDELIPSGEISSYRSNPLKLASFALSRKDPGYVDRARRAQTEETPASVLAAIRAITGEGERHPGIGSAVIAVKPGDGSAREQAASSQRVLGGLANIAHEYANKRYRSNLINWGMIPFTCEEISTEDCPFDVGDYIFVPGIRQAILDGAEAKDAYVIKPDGSYTQKTLHIGSLTADERQIILDGCLINFYRRK